MADDLIDRQAVWEKTCKGCTRHGDNLGECYFDEPCEKLLAAFVCASTIDPESLRPKGEWKPRTDVVGFVNCSVCHECNIYDDWADGKKWSFCPNCGADMRKEA